MKTLVIGGTEFFGKCIVRKLLLTGHEVTILSRGNKKPSEFWSEISHIACDRTSYVDFKSKLQEKSFDVVIDNQATTEHDISSIIDVFAKRPKPPQYILCSSVAVYYGLTMPTGGFKEEEASFASQPAHNWQVEYANGKRSAESYLQQHHGAMPFTILRPTVVEGPGDPHKRTWFWIQRIIDGGPILLSEKDKDTCYRHVFAEDVANAFILAVGNMDAYNQTFNVAGEEVLTVEEYINVVAKALGKEVPTITWKSQKEIEDVLSDYSLPLFFEQVQLIPCIDKIKAKLGYTPSKVEEWMKTTVEAYRTEKELSHGYEHRGEELQIMEDAKKLG